MNDFTPTPGGILIPFRGKRPRVAPDAFIAPTAVLIGDVEVGPQIEGLGLTAQAGGAQARARRQGRQALGAPRRALTRNEGVAHILTRRNGRDGQARRQLTRHVLHRVDGAIDAAVEQGLLDLLGEELLAADLEQAAVLDAVARGGDHDQGRDTLDLLDRRVGANPEAQRDGALHGA